MGKTTYEMWAHGTSLRVQDLDVCTAAPHGSGMELNGVHKGATWIHVPVPTPVVAAGEVLRVSKARIRFKTHHTRIVHLHVWDGAAKIAAHDELHLEGSWQTKTIDVEGYRVWGGVTVSAYLEFWDPMSDAEIDAMMNLANESMGSGSSWHPSEAERAVWRQWGVPAPGQVHIAGAGCVFEEAVFLQVKPGAPTLPPVDIKPSGSAGSP